MKLFICLILTLLLFSCSEPRVEEGEKDDTVLVFESDKNAGLYGLSNFVESAEIHKLPLPDSINVAVVSSVITIGSKLWVYDLPGKQILAFDLATNTLLYRIHNFGEGPLEYTGILDFDVNEADTLTIFSLGQRLVEFHQGTPVADFRFPVQTRGIAKVNSGIIGLFPYEGVGRLNSLTVYDKNGNKTGELGEFIEEVKGGIPPTFKQRVNDSKVYLNDFSRNTIVELEKDEVVNEKKIEFDSPYDSVFLLYFIHFNNQSIVVVAKRSNADEAIYTGYFKDGEHRATISSMVNDIDGSPIPGIFDAYNEDENALIKVNTSEVASMIHSYYSDENMNKYFDQEDGYYVFKDAQSMKVPADKFEAMRNQFLNETAQEDNYLILQKYKVK